MFESRYKDMMKKCVLSDDEKEKSFERILEKTVDAEHKEKKSHKKILISTVCLAACLAMFGGITVYAYNENWLEPIFGISEDENDFATVDRYNGTVTGITYDIDGYDAELIYSCGNDKVISAVVKLTKNSSVENEGTLEGYAISDSITDQSCKYFPNDENSYYMYTSLHIMDGTVTNGNADYEIRVGSDTKENEYENETIGSLTLNYDISAAEKCPVFVTENKGSKVECVSLSPFYININTQFNQFRYQRTDYYNDVNMTLNFDDGTTKEFDVPCISMSSTVMPSGTCYETLALYELFSENIIDCSKVISIQIGDDILKPADESETEITSESTSESTTVTETEITSETTSENTTVSETEIISD